MKLKNRHERDLIKHIRSITDQFRVVRTRRGHLKVTFEGTQKISVTLSSTPSDHRSAMNGKADIRRAMINAGVLMKDA